MDIKNLPPTELIALKKYFENKYHKLDPKYWDKEKDAMEAVKKIETILDKMAKRIINDL
jgi:hypothetical protein